MFNHVWVRDNQLTSREFHFISVINSYSGESHLQCKHYAEILKCSVRTIKRIIQSLIKKGIICVRYGFYKSIHISLYNIAEMLWKPNLNKIKRRAQGPKSTFKRANGGTTNIESNKEINKSGFFKPYQHEENTGSSGIFSNETRGMLDAFFAKFKS